MNRVLFAVVLFFIAACGQPVDVGEPGSSSAPQTDDSAQVSFDLRGLFAHLCTDGPIVGDCLRACLKDAELPWCDRYTESCRKNEPSSDLCDQWRALP